MLYRHSTANHIEVLALSMTCSLPCYLRIIHNKQTYYFRLIEGTFFINVG